MKKLMALSLPGGTLVFYMSFSRAMDWQKTKYITDIDCTDRETFESNKEWTIAFSKKRKAGIQGK